MENVRTVPATLTASDWSVVIISTLPFLLTGSRGHPRPPVTMGPIRYTDSVTGLLDLIRFRVSVWARVRVRVRVTVRVMG